MAQKPKPIDPTSDQGKQVRREFKKAANMTPSQIEKWLKTDESKSVGQSKGASGKSVGRDSARKIVRIKRKKVADLTGTDVAWMEKVNGYVARHAKQKPKGGKAKVRESDWYYSMKNWGHDPLK